MIRYYYILLIILLVNCFSCKEKQKEEFVLDKDDKIVETQKDSLKSINSIDFNKSPIEIKDYTLNDNEFWVTSSMIDTKYIDSALCQYKDYHLIRGYNILNKKNDEIVNQLDVYVVDNNYKWNREKAEEEFLSFDVSDSSIKLWGELFVGMSKESLLERVKNEEYHEDFGTVTVYSKILKTNFYFENDKVNNIKVNKRCSSYSKQQLLDMNNLDSVYTVSKIISPNYLKADFNGDKKEDIVFLVEEIKSKKVGLIFFHSNDSYYVVGAGIKFNDDLDNMNWLDVLELENNKTQHETLFDEETFDIIGDRKVIIPFTGVSIRKQEASGGLLYFKDEKYNYLHQGC